MTDWVVTATTIYCEAVDDEVTLIVSRDGTLKCTGYQKYSRPDREAVRALNVKGRRSGRQLRCEGLECKRATHYRDRLLTGEAGAGGNAGGE
jgi:hypothetical protein